MWVKSDMGFLEGSITFCCRLQRLGVEPDLTTFNIMLKSCGLTKSFDKAITLYEDMKTRAASGSLKLDVFTYTTTIDVTPSTRLFKHMQTSVLRDFSCLKIDICLRVL
jgi:pentatricopeptide repeat protein